MRACRSDGRSQAGIVEADADLVRLEWLDAILGDVDGHLHLGSNIILSTLDSPNVARAHLESVNISYSNNNKMRYRKYALLDTYQIQIKY